MTHDRPYYLLRHIPAPRLRDADSSVRPHTYGVRVCSCDAFATEPCRPTACTTHATNLSSSLTDNCSLVTYHCSLSNLVSTILHSSFLILNWSHTFSAKERDAETGLSYFGARYYSSDLSIWLSVDPMSDKYPSLSPYVYCTNNPVKLVDPNGDTIRFNTEAERTFVLPLLNKNGKSYSPEFEAIYNKLNESDHTYTFSLTHDNGKEEGHFENKDAHCSIIHYSTNTYKEHYGASKYRNLFEETYHAYQYDRKRIVINSCFSEAMAWKFSSLAPGTTYVNTRLGYTVMARCRDLPAWQLALELKFGMLPNESYCGTESEWGKGRYHKFPLAVPEERIFFPPPALFLTK